MTFTIALSRSAEGDLAWFRKFDRQRIRDALAAQLTQQPVLETRNRKKLRPNQLAKWELRIGKFRVFYDLDEAEALVKVVAVGYKEGNLLFIRGEEYEP